MNGRSDSSHEKSTVQIDRGTLLVLLSLCKRMIDTFGLIAPVLELAREEYEVDHVWHFSAAESCRLKVQRRWIEIRQSMHEARDREGLSRRAMPRQSGRH